MKTNCFGNLVWRKGESLLFPGFLCENLWVSKVDVAVFCSQTSSIVGGVDCFNTEQRQLFAQKAVQLYGGAPNISVSTVGSLGSIICQLINPPLLHS